MRTRRSTALIASLLLAIATSSFAANTHFWSMSTGDQFGDRGSSIAVDPAGNVYVAGNFSANANFGGTNLVSNGNATDVFLVKFTSSGEHVWSKSFGGTSTDVCNAIAVDKAGSVYITGSYAGTIDFGGGNLNAVAMSDVFVAKFTPSGAHAWSRSAGGAGNDAGTAIGVGVDVVVAGVVGSPGTELEFAL